jgi:hypothetical protein
MLAEFGGKGDRISKDGLGDGVIRRWGDGEKPEISDSGIRLLAGREFGAPRRKRTITIAWHQTGYDT